MAEEGNNIFPFRRGEQGEPAERSLKSGGGGGTYDDMEARVKALEEKFGQIDAKLGSIGNDLAYIKGKFEGMPSASAFGELKGRVDSLPTTTKVATLLAIAVALVTLLTKWPEISTLIR